MCPQTKVKDENTTDQYRKVILCETKCKTNKSLITDINTYKNELTKFTIPTELVGGINQLVKPYFDIDTELPKDTLFDEQAVLLNATENIKKMFNLLDAKDIYILKRDKREKNGKYKYSYHITVDNISITNLNIKKLIDNAKITDFDTGVYDKNRALHPIYTSRKVDKENDFIDVPEFKPYNVFKGYLKKVDIVKYCPSYIEESFVNWNVNFPDIAKVKRDNKLLDILIYSDTETRKIAKSLVLDCLSIDRANDYTKWMDLGFCLFNIDDNLIDVWDEFSEKGDSYKAGECEKLWSNMKKGSISIGSLKYWAKQDNPTAYNNIVYTSNYKYVMDALGTDGSHYDVAKVCYNYFKGKLYYDTTSKSYYSVNDNTNIWKKDAEGLCVSHYLSTTICELFMKAGVNIMKEQTDCEEKRKMNEEKFKKCMKIATKLKDENYTNSIKKSLKSLCAIDNFNCKILDVNINTFAFGNCLFDLKNKVIRLIEPDDHISTTTGYNFDINVSKDKVKEIKHLIRSMFKTDEMYKYLIDVLSMSMFGKNLHQEFYIFNGNGSNGKSVLMNLLLLSFGDYCAKVNATTFTKESRGANETSELHACKASRLLCVEEPKEDEKLISSRLKEYSGDTIIKTRGLHENAFSFTVMFCMIFYCNQLCELSKIDNAVGRRLRLLNFPFKFCDEPNIANENEKLADMTWGTKLNNEHEDCIYYKQAFMLILWENWCSKDFVNKKIATPKEVMEITKQYMNGCNKVKLFIDEFCEIVEEEKERIPARDLYSKFKGIYPNMDERSFAYNMMELGIEKRKCRNCFKYTCIKLKDNNDSDSD